MAVKNKRQTLIWINGMTRYLGNDVREKYNRTAEHICKCKHLQKGIAT